MNAYTSDRVIAKYALIAAKVPEHFRVVDPHREAIARMNPDDQQQQRRISQ